MKTLVIFDTSFGNTKIIAETISKELGNDTKAISVSDFNNSELEGKTCSWLVVQSLAGSHQKEWVSF